MKFRSKEEWQKEFEGLDPDYLFEILDALQEAIGKEINWEKSTSKELKRLKERNDYLKEIRDLVKR